MKSFDIAGQSWLDAGSGAGMFNDLVGEAATGFKLFQTDLAFDSLKLINSQKKSHRRRRSFAVQSDLEFLPFKNNTFQGSLISSVLQWLEAPEKGLREIVRTLKPDGKVVFAAFLTGSFFEVRLLREKRDLSVPVKFLDDSGIKDLMNTCGLEMVESSNISDVNYFHSAWAILKYLSDIGSSAVDGRRLSRAELLAFCEEYENRFGTDQGIPLSYRVGCGIARKRYIS